MSLPWTGNLKGIVSSAERDAGKMSVRLNTALLLRSMVKNPGPSHDVLSRIGVTLEVCESGLRMLPLSPESLNSARMVYERAGHIAMRSRCHEVSALHLLLAMLDEPCMGQALLLGLRVDFTSLRRALLTYSNTVESVGAPVQRSHSAVMNSVAVQRKSVYPTVTTFIEPEPAASFGIEDLSEASRVSDGIGMIGKPRPRLLTPDEIQRLPIHRSGTFNVSVPLDSSSAMPVVRESPKTYRSTSSREIQQATTLDLARRLLQQKKKNQRNTEEQSVLSTPVPPSPSSPSPSVAECSTAKSEPDVESVKSSASIPESGSVLSARGGGARPNREVSSRIVQTHPVNESGTVCARHQKRYPVGYTPAALNPNQFPALTQYGRNLLAEAQLGRIDPVIDRDEEINQLIDVLNKRRSNNPVLVGEAGVGKTAIIEGLAVKMARHEAPRALDDRTIIALDYGAILCGTQLRGAVQERIKKIRDEIKKAHGLVILFLDELHNWLTSGTGDPNADAAFELKMALSRGELMCIGASTPQDLRRAFNMDPAFERRFDFIEVKAPSAATSVRILRSGIIDQYAKHHGVTYSTESIQDAVRLSERYIHERALPDKAISILDRAGSLCERDGAQTVLSEHVARVVAQMAEIPVERLLMSESHKLMKMETILGERLIGHEENIHRMASVIRRNHAGFETKRPIGSFLFLGPTGVGKTEAAKVLADFLFGSSKSICRFDMSEFMEQHSVAKLIGAPAGYVGFDDGGLLTEALRRRPYQIVLFDEIEKAHPDVFNILLQILDEGRLTDAKGRHVDFSNTVIIMTSNLGAQKLAAAAQGGIGFAGSDGKPSVSEADNIILQAARAHFSPELWNRIEEKLVFHPLDQPQIQRIAHLLLSDSANRLKRGKGITLSFDESALIPYLIKNGGFDPRYGARPMRQTIQTLVESQVADWILLHDTLPQEIFVALRNGKICVEPIEPL